MDFFNALKKLNPAAQSPISTAAEKKNNLQMLLLACEELELESLPDSAPEMKNNLHMLVEAFEGLELMPLETILNLEIKSEEIYPVDVKVEAISPEESEVKERTDISTPRVPFRTRPLYLAELVTSPRIKPRKSRAYNYLKSDEAKFLFGIIEDYPHATPLDVYNIAQYKGYALTFRGARGMILSKKREL